MDTGEVAVYYFEKPTIGYCPDCGVSAVYLGGNGLVCPKNTKHKLSLFVHDEESRHPEDEEGED